MERKLQERMVGAGVLILVLVILGPVILSGGDRDDAAGTAGQSGDEFRSHTFSLDRKPATAARPAPATAIQPPARSVPAAPGSPPQPAAPAAPPAPPTPAMPAAPAKPPPAVVSQTEDEPPPAAPKPRPAAPPATSSQAAAAGWVVQVGTFGQKANADRLVTSLKNSGFDAFVSATERGGKPLYRVRVGPAGSRDAAAAVASRLAQSGQAGQVVSQ